MQVHSEQCTRAYTCWVLTQPGNRCWMERIRPPYCLLASQARSRAVPDSPL